MIINVTAQNLTRLSASELTLTNRHSEYMSALSALLALRPGQVRSLAQVAFLMPRLALTPQGAHALRKYQELTPKHLRHIAQEYL